MVVSPHGYTFKKQKMNMINKTHGYSLDELLLTMAQDEFQRSETYYQTFDP
jgi:hypothetical protein